jgi:hypothetical protein
MTWGVWVVAAALQAAAIASAHAQATEMLPMQDFSARARAEANGCQQACKLEFNTCNVTTAGRQRGVCDTKLVRCRIACQDCASKVARCGFEARFSSAGLCSQQVGACRPQEDAGDGLQALITFDGGDGSSRDNPVIIRGARNTREGLEAQSLWVGKTYWGWRRHARHPATKVNERVLDPVEFQTPQGEVRTVFFDVSEFYGKF